MNLLPQNEKKAWPLVKLGDVCTVQRGIRVTRKELNDDGKYIVYQNSLKPLGKFDSFNCDANNPFMIMALAAGEVGFSDTPFWAADDCTYFQNLQNLDSKYLFFILLLNKQELRRNVKQTTIPRLSNKFLENLVIPLPPLSVQHEIVARLEYELAKTDSLAANFKRIAELADAEFKAELEEIFTGAHGEVVHLGDVCKVDGVLVKDVERYERFPHIGIDCIEKDTGRLLAYRTVGEDGIKSGKYYFSNHHIIYSKIRPNLNKVAVPEFEGLCSADSYPILPGERCNRYWLAYLMRSAVFLNYVVPISNTRTGMPKVNRDELLNFEFMLPPLEKQREIVVKLDTASLRCEKLKVAARKGLRSAENLRPAILSEAFTQ